MKIVIKVILVIGLGVAGYFVFGPWGGLSGLVLFLEKFLGRGKKKSDLDKETTLDLIDVRRRKDELHENTSIDDLASKLSKGSNRARRRRD